VIALAIAVGGGIGALARYGLNRALETDGRFPLATFVVNVSGCFAIGLLTVLLIDRHHAPLWLRGGLIVGVLGGYTTFSTFGLEGFTLIQARELPTMLAYTAGSVVTGLLAVYAGTLLGRAL
jgi:CrcB protein